MSYTRANLRTRVLQLLDAVGSGRWTTTAGGELDQIGAAAFDREWRGILEVQPYYRTARVTITQDSSGQVALSSLTTGSGDSAKRFNRIISIFAGTATGVYLFEEVHAIQMPFATQMGFLGSVWWREGDVLQFLPVSSGQQMSAFINWIPQTIDVLTGESVTVDFPDHYEEVLVHQWAADALLKGGVEADASAIFGERAKSLREEMLRQFARLSLKPPQVRYADSSLEWGGQ